MFVVPLSRCRFAVVDSAKVGQRGPGHLLTYFGSCFPRRFPLWSKNQVQKLVRNLRCFSYSDRSVDQGTLEEGERGQNSRLDTSNPTFFSSCTSSTIVREEFFKKEHIALAGT